MSRTILSFVVCISTILALAVEATAQTTADRITRKVDAGDIALVSGSLHPLARPEFDQGRVSGSMMLHHVAMVFRLSQAQQEQLGQLLAEQQDPSSANYHKWLTPERYANRFGLTRNDAAKVTAWLKSQGLTVEGVSRGRTEIYFSGTAAQVGAVLRTEFHSYVVNGESHFANATEPSVPAAFAGMVLGFRNLDNFRPKSRMKVAPHFTSSISGNHYLAPDDFATIYDVHPLYNNNLDGTGVTIGVVGDSAIRLSDIEAFRSAANLPANDPTVVIVDGTPVENGDEVEADLDLEWSGGIAKNATIIYFVSATDAFNALDFALQQGTAVPVISNSFGLCEADEGSNNAASLQQLIQQGNSQGQTVTSAAGDSGAADCETQSSTVATTGLAVDIPAAIPEVTAVGGSEFSADSANPAIYWSPVNNANSGSAIVYIPEMTWNDGPSPGTGAFTTLASGGGGASTFFSKPAWQTGTGVPSGNSRFVPDVSLNASPAHDGYLLCSQAFFTSNGSSAQSCVSSSNPFRASDNSLAVVGGTSAGAPTMAGIIAILNQGTRSCGLGNINGSTTNTNVGLYAMAASTPTAFHDINPAAGAGVVPGNIVPCTKGTTSCPATAPFQFGFNTTAGYDEATGLGSIDADVLATAWPGFNNPQPASTTNTVASSNPTSGAGVNVVFTATVGTTAPNCASTGKPALATTGTVQFTSDGNSIGTATVSNGQAQVATTTLAAGTHQIVATYQGDANYQGSTSSAITQTITDYAISQPNPATLTLTPGQSGTSTLTITANASVGFTGTVNFSCSPSSTTAEIACSFIPASLTLNSGTTSGQTVLTVATTAPTTALVLPGKHSRFGWMAASGGSLFAGVILMGAAPRRRWATLACLVTIALLSAGLGCGSSSSSHGNPGTPAGNYTITVTSTSTMSGGAGPTHNVAVPLTVQ